jgi:hypothetical protein
VVEVVGAAVVVVGGAIVVVDGAVVLVARVEVVEDDDVVVVVAFDAALDPDAQPAARRRASPAAAPLVRARAIGPG